MPINEQRARYHLKSGDLQTLFIDELGWNHFATPYSVTLANQTYTLSPLAERNGIAALRCEPTAHGSIPEYAIRRKIDQAVTKQVAEHIIVYVDTNGDRQIWQWVRREPGKPAAYREHSFDANSQSGDALVHKLRHVAYDLAEEESSTLTGAAAKLRKAFDVEKVTKKFFDLFKKQHADFLKQIEGIASDDDKAWYASVMLNRLMFVRFIQQKRFLADDPDYLRNRLRMVKEQAGAGRFHDFYRAFLLHLFHEGLGEKPADRTDPKNHELLRLLGKVPYLNGGIFSKHSLEETYAEAIRIPDSAFDAIFTFFDGFDWLLDNRPLKSEKEINPDVLGYIFEKYINQKEMGAYYTKEDITEYIGRNTIVPYLFDAAKERCLRAFEPRGTWQIAQADPDRYIFPAMKHGMDTPLPQNIAAGIDSVPLRGGWNKPADAPFALPTEIWREVVARRTRCEDVRHKLSSGEVQNINDFITLNLNIRQFAQDVIESCEDPELLQAIWKSVETVRVLDPTVGSGAFLFAALNILEPLYEACLDRMEAFVGDTERAQATWAGEMAFVNEVSAQQAFLEESSTEYAEQFKKILALIADHRDRRYHIYKSIIVNNLFGVDIMEEATEICKLRLFLKLVAQIESVEDLEPLPDIDFNIRAGNTLVGYASIEDIDRLWTETGQLQLYRDRDKLEAMASEYAALLHDFRDQQLGLSVPRAVTKKDVERAANEELRPELDKDLWRLYRTAGKVTEKTTLAQFLRSHSPLHWFVEFPEVMAAGGFDVVTGNPPYLEKSKLVPYCRPTNSSTENCKDIYAWVVERTTRLRNENARIGIIIPVSVAASVNFSPLRECLSAGSSRTWLSHYANRPATLFEGAQTRLSIVLMQAGKTHLETATTQYHRWDGKGGERHDLFNVLGYVKVDANFPDFHTLIPKLANKCGLRIQQTINSAQPLSRFLCPTSKFPVYWARVPGYFCQFFLIPPKARPEAGGEERIRGEMMIIYLRNVDDQRCAHAILSSSVYAHYYSVYTDIRHINPSDVKDFPFDLDALTPDDRSALVGLSIKLDECLSGNTKQWRKSGLLIDSVNSAAAKPILDEIDRVLAKHYGFTDEELDFIINYDIKYRMGKGGEEEGAE